MVLERLMGRWLDSAKKHLRESMVISYRIAVARAVRYLGARELVSLSDADLKDAKQQMESRGLLKKKDSFVCLETDGSPLNYNRFTYMMRKEGFTLQSIRKLYEDKASETAAILREGLSMEEIGILRTQIPLRRENGTSEEAFSLPLEGKVSADRLTDEVGIA